MKAIAGEVPATARPVEHPGVEVQKSRAYLDRGGFDDWRDQIVRDVHPHVVLLIIQVRRRDQSQSWRAAHSCKGSEERIIVCSEGLRAVPIEPLRVVAAEQNHHVRGARSQQTPVLPAVTVRIVAPELNALVEDGVVSNLKSGAELLLKELWPERAAAATPSVRDAVARCGDHRRHRAGCLRSFTSALLGPSFLLGGNGFIM